jgi:hypothetical protein
MLRCITAREEIVRVSRGLYALTNPEISGNRSFVEASKRYPGGVICLTSARNFHGIGTQMPYEIWMMRPDRKMTPNRVFPIRFDYCTVAAFSHGLETHRIEDMEVSIFSPPRQLPTVSNIATKLDLMSLLKPLGRDGRQSVSKWSNSGKRPRFSVCKGSYNYRWGCLQGVNQEGILTGEWEN